LCGAIGAARIRGSRGGGVGRDASPSARKGVGWAKRRRHVSARIVIARRRIAATKQSGADSASGLLRRLASHNRGHSCVDTPLRGFAQPTNCGKRNTMRTTLVLILIALSLEPAAAREIRRDAMPEAFWGTWTPGSEACKEKDPSAIVLSARAYAGPAGSCA